MGTPAAGLHPAALITEPAQDAGAVNRVAAVEGLAVRSWPGESLSAVFSELTVRTLLISETAAAVLDLAATRPVTSAEAVSLLGAADEPVDSAATDVGADLALIEETITGLVAAGLLRRVE